MSTLVLVNTVTIVQNSQPSKVFAGESISDAGIQASVLAAGGVLAPATDANVAAAATLVTKLRSHGANEGECNAVMMSAYASTAYASQPVHVVVDIPLATIQAQTSGTAFNIGAALPTNAKLTAASITALTDLSGGSAASAHASLQGTGDSAGSILGSTNVFTGAPTTPQSVAGSNPYQSRSGQQLQMVITGDGTHALSTLTAGHLSVDLYYSVLP